MTKLQKTDTISPASAKFLTSSETKIRSDDYGDRRWSKIDMPATLFDLFNGPVAQPEVADKRQTSFDF